MAILYRKKTVYAPRDFENEPPSLKLGAPGPAGPGPWFICDIPPYALGAGAGLRAGGPAPPDFSFSWMIRSIARLAAVICGRVP